MDHFVIDVIWVGYSSGNFLKLYGFARGGYPLE